MIEETENFGIFGELSRLTIEFLYFLLYPLFGESTDSIILMITCLLLVTIIAIFVNFIINYGKGSD